MPWQLILPDASVKVETPRKGRFSWSKVFTALGFLAFLGSWLVPNHYLPWISFHNESTMFVALALLAGALLSQGIAFQFDRIPQLFVLLILVVTLQLAAGLIAYHGDAVLSSLYLAGFAIAWWAGSNAARAKPWVDQLLTWLPALILIAAVVSVYIALLQWLGLEAGHANLVTEKDSFGRPGGNLAQPNHLATLLLMGTAMCVLLHVQGRLRTWHFSALVVWLGVGLTMTESRASWISAAGMGILYLWRGRSWIRNGIQGVFVWWGLLVFMWLAWKPVNEYLLLTATRGVTALAQDSARLQMWRQMLIGIELSPWWGYGWRQTLVGQKAAALHEPGGLITDYAHSLVLDLCLWLGVPLALLLMAGAAWWLLKVARRISNVKQLLLMCSVIPVLVHSLVEFPFAYAYFLFTTAAILGILSALQTEKDFKVPKSGLMSGRTTPAMLVMVFASLSTWAALDYVKAEDDFRVMRFEMRNVGRRPDGHEVPNLYLLNQLGEMLKLGRMKPTPGMRPEDIERLRKASEATMWATGNMRYAVALALNGEPEEAARQLTILRAYYGETSYKQAKALFLELQKNQYPELALVKLP